MWEVQKFTDPGAVPEQWKKLWDFVSWHDDQGYEKPFTSITFYFKVYLLSDFELVFLWKSHLVDT